MFREETFETKEQQDSITNLLSTLEKDEDIEAKLKSDLVQDPDLLSTLEKDVTDFKSSVVDNKVTPQLKTDELPQKTLESNKSNLLSTLDQDKVEPSTKIVEDSIVQKTEIGETSPKVKENITTADASKLEDSNFFRDFGKENQSLFSAELDDTVKMEETFSVENTSRLVKLSPERMDESLSSHDASFRANINVDSREPNDLQENSTSRPMSVSDEQTNEGDFTF